MEIVPDIDRIVGLVILAFVILVLLRSGGFGLLGFGLLLVLGISVGPSTGREPKPVDPTPTAIAIQPTPVPTPARTPARTVRPTIGGLPIDFELATFDGQQFRLSDYQGQVVLFNFWASWCGPCREEMPDLALIYEDYRDRGLVMIGIATSDTFNEATAFAQEFNLPFPNGFDQGNKIGTAYNVRAIPTTFIVGSDGRIKFYKIGSTTYREVSRVLDRLF